MTRPLLRGALALASVVALAVGIAVAGPAAEPAHAVSYPSWNDVQNAKANEAAASAEVTRVQGILTGLQTAAASAQQAAITAGEKMQAAQEAFFAADQTSTALSAQAKSLAQQSDEASTRAGRVAAQLFRSGGRGLTTTLLLSSAQGDGSDPADLLNDLGSMTKLTQSTSDIYASAQAAKNQSAALAAQAASALAERTRLKQQADDALTAAVAASQAADAAAADMQDHEVTLNAQLAALKDTASKTVAGYQAGVVAAQKAEAERKRKAALAAAAAAAANAGKVSAQGWAKPAVGSITDPFGPRPAPCAGCSTYHLGADIGAGYSTPIRAAHSGTVTYAGWAAGYGNFIIVSDGDGIATAYGHIVDGGIMVGYGQKVQAGQQIARVGSTGHSTGPHLHFEVRINGVQTDPIAWMRNHGAPIG